MGDRTATSKERGEPTRRSADRMGRRRLSVDERREELIRVALELFGDRPPEDISIDDVANAAGASRALVYHYFGGKRELYLAALHRAAEHLRDLLESSAEDGPLDRLAVVLHGYFDFVEHYAAGFTALLRGGPAYRTGEVGEVIEGIRAVVMNRVRGAIGVGEPGPVLRITLRSWLASVEAAGLDWLERRDVPREDVERMLIEYHVMLLSVAARRDPALAALAERLSGEG